MLIILALFILANATLAFISFFNNPRSWTNRLFALFIVIMTTYLTLNTYLSVIENKVLFSRIIISLGALINLMVFLFLKTFPGDKITIRKPLLFGYLSVTGFLFFAGFTNLIFADVVVNGNNVSPVPGVLMPVFLLHTVFFVLGGLILFAIKYRKAIGIEKNKFRLVLLSFLILFFLILVLNFIFPVFLQIGYFVPLLPIYILIFNGIVTYAIIKHKLLDIRPLITRFIVYILLILLLGSFYTVGIFVLSQYFFKNQIEISQLISYALIALFIALTFNRVREYIEKITDKLFFKGKYNSNRLVSVLTEIMASTIHLETLTQNTLQELTSTMRISKGAFVIFRKDEGYDVIHEGYQEEPKYDIQKLLLLCELKRLVIFEEEPEGQIKEIMRAMDIAMALPLFEDGHKEGLLILGEKKSGEIYSQQDIEVLNIFGPEMLVAIQNAKSYQEISKFNMTLKQEVDKATKELRDANERLRQLDKLKDEFVSVASHELRTPMTAIKSYLWMALEGRGGPISEKQKYYLQRAYNSVDRLIRLVSDMLNVSRIDSGRISLQLGSIDIQKVVQEVFDEVMPRIQELGINLVMAPAQALPQVLGDSDKVKEVLFNLIGNAMKFTSKGGTITVSFAQKENMIETTVTDTGTGIDPANISKLFQKFSMIADSYMANSSIQGTGLGLYISKSIVELHGGKIWAMSEGHGKGTQFTFSLKVATEDDKKKIAEQPVDSQKPMIDIIHTGV